MLDLLVIGTGLAGLMAAYTAAQAGRSVHVIAKGLGALQLSAGTIDVLGYVPAETAPALSRAAVARPLDVIGDLTAGGELSGHPYAIAGVSRLRAALDGFVALSHEIGIPYRGAAVAGENLWLPSPVGAARPTFLAPEAQLAGDLSRPEPMLIVGVHSLRDFFPELIAENLSKQGHSARAAFVPMQIITERSDRNTTQLASALDEPARRERLAAEIKKLVRPGERVGLPAILGLVNHGAVVRELQAVIGAPVFEIPTLPPSVPGIRLNTALRRCVEQMGVRVDINMDVRTCSAEDVDGRRILWVESEASARPLRHHARNYLLATGGILGGGITGDAGGGLAETVLGLPLETPAARSEWFRPRFFDPAGHQVFHSGVRVDDRWQPVDSSGACVHANVWAAGSLLAHADPILERSLEGIALVTGVAAAEQITNGQ